jgi:hypothetical protein
MLTNLDVGLEVDIPYLGFLLQDGKTKILFDTGISGSYIVDGKAWAGRPSCGGDKYVVKSLNEKGVRPQDIDMVIYSHYTTTTPETVIYFPGPVCLSKG